MNRRAILKHLGLSWLAGLIAAGLLVPVFHNMGAGEGLGARALGYLFAVAPTVAGVVTVGGVLSLPLLALAAVLALRFWPWIARHPWPTSVLAALPGPMLAAVGHAVISGMPLSVGLRSSEALILALGLAVAALVLSWRLRRRQS